MAEISYTCLEKYRKDLIILEQNVSSGMTKLFREIDGLISVHKPYRYTKSNEREF